MKNIIGALGITKLISSAFNMISNSMDSAINRLDTMNNFPKVMSNLNISAQDSTKAINKLSNGLKGIPTTLDAGALAVQRFTSKNGDVHKSTDLFLALNNAILAGGASTQIQESALEQLSQSYAKGKPDMMEWRTAQMAMPAQLKQIATQMLGNRDALDLYLEKARQYSKDNPLSSTAGELVEQLEAVSNGTGDMTTALGTGLRAGIISMDDFMDTIVQMNKTGTKNIKSFEEQAKNSTGGIKTNITNMKTAVARGVANIISSMDKALKKTKLKSVGNTIKLVGEQIEKVLNKISKSIEKVNFNKLISTLKILVPIIGSVVAGFIAYHGVIKAIQIINVAKKIYDTATAFLGLIPYIRGAKDAMDLLYTTFSANPIGLVVAGITALIGVIAISQKMFGVEKNQIDKNNEALDNYKKEMKDVEKAKQDYLKSHMGEIQSYQNLAVELNNLVDENGKVKEGYEERAKFIVGTLNEALGTEIKLNNGVVEGYENVQNAIADVIEQKRAKVLLDAHEQEYNKAVENETKLQETLTSAIKEQKKARNELNSWVSETAKQYGLSKDKLLELMNTNDVFNSKLPISGDELIKLQGKYDGLKGSIVQANSSLKDSQKTYDDNQLKIIDYELALQGFSDKNYDTVSKIYNDTINYQGKTDTETYKYYQKNIETMQQYLDRLKQNQSKYSEEEYSALVSAGEAKLSELQNQQAKYKTAIDDGGKKVVESTKKITADELLAMKDKTIEFRKTADGHIQAVIDGVNYKSPMTKKQAEKLGKDMAKEIDKAKSDSRTAGENIISGTQQGISNRNLQNSAFSSIASFGSKLLSTLKKSLKEHSPSKASREYGQYLLQGLNLGVDDEKEKVFDNIEDFGEDVLNRMQNAVNIETGKMSFSGTSGTVNEILSANATFEGTTNNNLYLDGEKIYENQQKISARKNLQYGGVK